MGKAKKRSEESTKNGKSVLSEYMAKTGSLKDLSDEKRAKILAEDFVEFQKQSAKKLGMQIGTRLQMINTEDIFGHKAVLVPVKIEDKKNEKPNEQPTETNEEKSSE